MPDRIRLGATIALLLTLTAPLVTAQTTDNARNGGGGGRNGGGPGGGGPGGGGPGGGGWGGGGPGGGGWGGGGPGGGGPGGGGGGTSPTALIQNVLVQDDLKMTDKQKDQVKQINADAEKKRVQVMEKAQKQATAVRLQAAEEAAAAAEANGGTPFNANANNGNGNPNNGNGNNGGGRGGRGGRNDPGNQVMRQADEEFRSQVEAALLKTLEPKQKTRIKQIALQAEGAGAFNNAEVIEKLGLTEEQVAAIEAIRNDSRQSGRQLMGQLFNNGGNNNGGNNNGGNNGGPGGGRPDPATFQTPEFQAKLKTVQDGQQKLDDQTMATVGKALTKAQRATFQKMVGEKFDVAALRQGFMNRFRAPGTPAATPTQTASAATPAAATPATAAATPAKEAAKPAARKSLRDARGGASQP